MSIMQSGCAGTAAAIGADIFYESIDLASNLLNEGATWLNNRALVIENRIQSVQKEDESTEEEKKFHWKLPRMPWQKADHSFDEVELILQNPELPNGCEVTSLAMLLKAAGYPIEKTVLYENYLPRQDFSCINGLRYGPDPAEAYAGNAASSSGGWYCLEEPILAAGNAWLKESGNKSKMLFSDRYFTDRAAEICRKEDSGCSMGYQKL